VAATVAGTPPTPSPAPHLNSSTPP
jgi:hypothetical protein